MHKFFKLTLWSIGLIVALFLTIIAIFIFLLFIFFKQSCTQELQLVKNSGSGYVASYYLTECGATTPYTTVILIGTSNDTGLKDRNIIYKGVDPHFLGMEWVGPKQLKINFSGCQTRIFVQKEKFKDIDIQYEIEKPDEGYSFDPCKY